jgi:transposase
VFVRKKHNKSGTISIQIIDKSTGQYRVVKSLGASKDPKRIEYLWRQAHVLIPELTGQTSFDFQTDNDKAVDQYMSNTNSLKVRVVGPEIVFGSLFDEIGFNKVEDELFRHLVITRLVYPGSKLKTIDYLQRYQGVTLQKDEIYRFLDKLSNRYKETVEHISFAYTRKVLGGNIGVVFYDMTTLYFESEDEDDLRKTGFSKDGKHQNPQIFLGLLVGLNGYPIGYEIFEGNTYEGHTLIPVLKTFEEKFNLSKPIVIADAGLLSNENLEYLTQEGYTYILGGRIKNESNQIKKKILGLDLADNDSTEIEKDAQTRLIVSYTDKRAKKDKFNRERGLKRLEKNLNRGRLTKSHINNRGYNKYLKMSGDINIEIDYAKFEADNSWDGLKGYVTNSDLKPEYVIQNYNNLWQIEKAFRISKTDLRIRPIYHRLRERIEAHISVAFSAYTIYKELERILYADNAPISTRRAADLTQTIYALDFELPDSRQKKVIEIGLSEEQKYLIQLFR